jgi:hypothetical protein
MGAVTLDEELPAIAISSGLAVQEDHLEDDGLVSGLMEADELEGTMSISGGVMFRFGGVMFLFVGLLRISWKDAKSDPVSISPFSLIAYLQHS